MEERDPVKPVAWVAYAENGNVRIWVSDETSRARVEAGGIKMEPAYSAATVTALQHSLSLAVEALGPFAEAAEFVPADQADTKIIAHVPAGPHATAFRKIGNALTAFNFRRAREVHSKLTESE